jgi:hypothetical protein
VSDVLVPGYRSSIRRKPRPTDACWATLPDKCAAMH